MATTFGPRKLGFKVHGYHCNVKYIVINYALHWNMNKVKICVHSNLLIFLALYSVRLAGSTSDSEGVVEVYLNDDNWVTICPSQWDNNDAIVVCRELGYEGGTATTIERDT